MRKCDACGKETKFSYKFGPRGWTWVCKGSWFEWDAIERYWDNYCYNYLESHWVEKDVYNTK